MSGKDLPIGDTGRMVGANVEHWRRQRGLALTELSDLVSQHGRHIPPNGMSRLEHGDRRVDVDDLAALALALQVSMPVLLDQPESESPTLLDGRAVIQALRLHFLHTGERAP